MTIEDQNTILSFIRLTHGGRPNREVMDYLTQALDDEHRTNQQSFWRFIRDLAGNYSQSKRGQDLRNEGAREFTRRIKEIDACLPYV